MKLTGNLAFILVATLLATTGPGPAESKGPVEVLERAFDDFILSSINDYINNSKDPSLSLANAFFNISMPSKNSTAAGSTTEVTVGDVRSFIPMTSSNLTLLTLNIDVRYPVLLAAGNYTLDGIANGLIIVHGQGNFSIMASEIEWEGRASLNIDLSGYASVHNLTFVPKEPSNTLFNVTFGGIEGGDVIGEIIKDYLYEVGSTIFEKMELDVARDLQKKLQEYLNIDLLTTTVEDILNGGTPTTPSANSTSTMSPTSTGVTGVTQTPDIIIDIGADLIGSGWIVPSTSACGYSTSINGFFCDGSPILVNNPISGVGFWMSPCIGECLFHYDNIDNKRIASLGVRALYNDNSNGSRIVVSLEHSSGTTRLEFFQKDGIYNEIDLSSYGILNNVNVTMENNGPGKFSILDTLTVFHG